MILKELALNLENIFKNYLSLDWDNSGLIIGRTDKDIKNIFICLDADWNSIKKASEKSCDLLLSHHPPYLDSFKKIISEEIKGRFIMEAVRNDISVYCAHTNFDIMKEGLNDYVFSLTGAKFLKYIITLPEKWYKFIIYSPPDYESKIRETMKLYGGGRLGKYFGCSFSSRGTGSFVPGENSRPFIGKKNELSLVEEVKIECIVHQDYLDKLISEVIKIHPYEQPAYDLLELKNKFTEKGIGIIGKLEDKKYFKEFLSIIKDNFHLKNFRYLFNDKFMDEDSLIEKIAVLNGSANFAANEMLLEDFDVLICGEINYHNSIMIVERKKAVIEIGHLESEIFFVDIMKKKIEEHIKKNNLDLNIFTDNSNILPWRYFIE